MAGILGHKGISSDQLSLQANTAPNFSGQIEREMTNKAQSVLQDLAPKGVRFIAVEGVVWMDQLAKIKHLEIHGKTDFILVLDDEI